MLISNNYSVIHVGPTDWPHTIAISLNSSGTVLTRSSKSEELIKLDLPVLDTETCLVSGANLTSIGTGPIGNGLNDRLEIAATGFGHNKDKSDIFHPLHYSNGTFTKVLLPGSAVGYGKGINNASRLIGDALFAKAVGHKATLIRAYEWKDGKYNVLDLPEPFEQSTSNGQNDDQLIVGNVLALGKSGRAIAKPVLWRNGMPCLLPTLRWTDNTFATAVNAQGVVVGRSFKGSHFRGCIWTDGVASFLIDPRRPNVSGIAPNADVTPKSINKHGTIVGEAVGEGGSPVAFVGNQSFVADLNGLVAKSSRWHLRSAKAINDAGQIACDGEYQGRLSALLLTPE